VDSVQATVSMNKTLQAFDFTIPDKELRLKDLHNEIRIAAEFLRDPSIRENETVVKELVDYINRCMDLLKENGLGQ